MSYAATSIGLPVILLGAVLVVGVVYGLAVVIGRGARRGYRGRDAA